ncbi:hypothetical protein Selsp_1873 [Selenomonas sputigena ATCC 35185]|uniref:Uncharacterized protein n=1 Tax=Selenomonas sputigena (strain ATCC 35185 / DSM 20758 / CCUG 44933 / VPI D19B-28) TaxID=546271 RepID=F4EW65_SELS3|nr:hypothetical protein Selsp_1873 [Selenomonas sputigena ATCC 35185]
MPVLYVLSVVDTIRGFLYSIVGYGGNVFAFRDEVSNQGVLLLLVLFTCPISFYD